MHSAQPQVRIIEHADIKRMLLAQKSYCEGALALLLYCAQLVDEQHTGTPEAAEEARLLLNRAQPTQLSQRFWVAHEDIGIKTGATVYVEREIAEGDPASTHHLYEGGLRQGDQNDIGEVEVDVLRLGSGPGWKCADNIIARQHHQVITLRKDDQAWQCTDPAYHVKHSICVANKRWNARLKLRYNRPHKRLRRCLGHRILRSGR